MMQKMSINRFKSQQSKRLNTIETIQNESINQIKEKKKIKQKVKIRYSCLQPVSLNTNSSKKLSNFCNQSQSSKFLLTLLQSTEQKRSSMLNNMINTKRKLFHTGNKSNDSFKHLIKIKTQEKQNYLYNKHSISTQRKKMFSHNKKKDIAPVSQRKRPLVKLTQKQSQFLKNSFNKRIKQIKLRKYFQKDQLQENPINLFESYGASIIGQKHKQNQDSMYFSQGIYVLCDGHGSNGKQISNFISEVLHNSLNQCLQEHKIDDAIILETYRKIQLQLQNSNFQISFSGCTCVSLLRYQNTLFCISLGDSRAILCKGYLVQEISITHKPDRSKQKQRIENYGGVVRQTQVIKDKYTGPMRIWAPGKKSWGPGLALSRAFGDKAARKYGVISTPEISKINLTSDQQFIVMGSDGLFDYFSDQQICNFVNKFLRDNLVPKQQIPHQLVNEAKKKWPEDSDDISCIIIFM